MDLRLETPGSLRKRHRHALRISNYSPGQGGNSICGVHGEIANAGQRTVTGHPTVRSRMPGRSPQTEADKLLAKALTNTE